MTRPWYPFYWSDYSGKTQHLTQGEHGAYILLMRYIYTTGKPIPEKLAYRVAMATLEQECQNVDTVLAEFFYLDGGWKHKKVTEIMFEADQKHKKAVESGSKGAKARYSNPSSNPSRVAIVTTTTTTDSDSDTPPPTKVANDYHLPDWVPKDQWAAHIAMRATLRGADNSKTTLTRLIAQLQNLMMLGEDPGLVLDQSTLRGWKFLKKVEPDFSPNQTHAKGKHHGKSTYSDIVSAGISANAQTGTTKNPVGNRQSNPGSPKYIGND